MRATTEWTSTDLRRFVLDQTGRGVAIPVLLFTTATLEAAAPEPGSPAADAAIRIAAEQGIDLATLELFSPDAYRLQSALGEAVLPDDA